MLNMPRVAWRAGLKNDKSELEVVIERQLWTVSLYMAKRQFCRLFGYLKLFWSIE